MLTSPLSLNRFAAAVFLAFTFAALNAHAAKDVAFKMPTPSKVGNPSAPQGGMFTINLRMEPATLNPITGTDLSTRAVKNYVLDRLLVLDPETREIIPNLAEKYDVSPDGKVFTFFLRKEAKFQDGTPVTAEDVKFSFDAVFDPKYNAAHARPYFEGIDHAEIVDPTTIKFITKEKYFGNLTLFAEDLYVVPKSVYGDPEAGKKKNKIIVGSGPYKLEKYDQGQSITLVRNKDWWGNKVDFLKGKYNFEHIRLRFVKDANIVIEMLKKGEIDFALLRPEEYATAKTEGPEWGKSVIKEKVENLETKRIRLFRLESSPRPF